MGSLLLVPPSVQETIVEQVVPYLDKKDIAAFANATKDPVMNDAAQSSATPLYNGAVYKGTNYVPYLNLEVPRGSQNT